MVLGEVAESERIADGCFDVGRFECELGVGTDCDGDVFCEGEGKDEGNDCGWEGEMHGGLVWMLYYIAEKR